MAVPAARLAPKPSHTHYPAGHRVLPTKPVAAAANGAGSWWLNKPREGFSQEAETRQEEMGRGNVAAKVKGIERDF